MENNVKTNEVTLEKTTEENKERKGMKMCVLTYNGVNMEDFEGCTVEKNSKGETVVSYKFKEKKESEFWGIVKFLLCGAVIILAIIGLGGLITSAFSLDEDTTSAEVITIADLLPEIPEPDNIVVSPYIMKTAVRDIDTMAFQPEPEIVEEDDIEYCEVPTDIDTSFKAFMDYRTITDKSSEQYKMQQNAWTGIDGVRRCGDDICVAMGTYYTDKCGARFEITLDTGKVFNVIVADIKDNAHTNSTNQYSLHCNGEKGCVLEFIVDENEIGETAQLLGDISCNNFEGEIVSIVEL